MRHVPSDLWSGGEGRQAAGLQERVTSPPPDWSTSHERRDDNQFVTHEPNVPSLVSQLHRVYSTPTRFNMIRTGGLLCEVTPGVFAMSDTSMLC
jgi:hypothetical protein